MRASLWTGKKRKLLVGLALSIIATLFPIAIYAYDGPHTPKESLYINGMVFIPRGDFIMGADDKELKDVIDNFGQRGDFEGYDFEAEMPKRHLYLKSFYIDKHEVTNAEYKRFIDATGYTPPRHWQDFSFPQDKEDNPVLYVNWFDAANYCSWEGKRLPTEEEWEKAARGSDGRVYPWGNKFDPYKAVTAEYVLKFFRDVGELTQNAAPLDPFRGDKSPYGVYDLAGNVMEWTESMSNDGISRIVKGASWVHLGVRARSASKDATLPEYVSHIIGFRCASDSNDNGLEMAMGPSSKPHPAL